MNRQDWIATIELPLCFWHTRELADYLAMNNRAAAYNIFPAKPLTKCGLCEFNAISLIYCRVLVLKDQVIEP